MLRSGVLKLELRLSVTSGNVDRPRRSAVALAIAVPEKAEAFLLLFEVYFVNVAQAMRFLLNARTYERALIARYTRKCNS